MQMELKMSSKKASANMWWIIIGAVIALVVMIILMVMFTDKTGTLEGGLSSCESKGGVCVTESGAPPLASTGGCPSNTFKSTAFECSENRVCCIGAPKKCTDNSQCKDKETCNTAMGYCFNK